MVFFTPVNQPAGVGSSGSVFTVTINKGFQALPIVKLEVEHVAGGATFTTVEFSTDPTFADGNQRIASFYGLNRTSPVSHTNYKKYYDWDGIISGGVIYCRLTPDTEVDNEYEIRVHFDEDVQEVN